MSNDAKVKFLVCQHQGWKKVDVEDTSPTCHSNPFHVAFWLPLLLLWQRPTYRRRPCHAHNSILWAPPPPPPPLAVYWLRRRRRRCTHSVAGCSGKENSKRASACPSIYHIITWQSWFCYKPGGWHKSMKLCPSLSQLPLSDTRRISLLVPFLFSYAIVLQKIELFFMKTKLLLIITCIILA